MFVIELRFNVNSEKQKQLNQPLL